ncbi:MAG: hypothetical protein AB7J34_26230 [Limisphaerales bacterium]
MTTFIDGPAKGQHLLLKSSPQTLTVVVDPTGKWDALDQPGDAVRPGERTFQYLRVGEPGFIHINRGRGRGGFFSMAQYRWADEQSPNGEIGLERLSKAAEKAGYSEEDVIRNGVPALVLYPMN